MRFSPKWSILLLFLFFCHIPVHAQVAVQLSPVIRQKFTDVNSSPLVGGQIFTYAAGTNTPQATYTDYKGLVQNSNPIILDSTGAATIWLTQQCYKIVVEDSFGALQYTQDGVCLPITPGGNNTFTGNNTFSGTNTFNGPTNISGGGSLSGTLSGNPNLSGTVTFAQTINASGAPPFTVLNSSLVSNLNVNDINGALYPPASALHSVPITTTAPITITGITTALVHAGAAGTGFAIGDLVNVTGGGGSGSILQVASVGAGGTITSFNILSGGSGYATGTGIALSVLTGAGIGAPTADITVGGIASQGAITPVVIPNCGTLGFSQTTNLFTCGAGGYKVESIQTTPASVGNTTTPTNLMTYTLPANELAINQDLQLHISGTAAYYGTECRIVITVDGTAISGYDFLNSASASITAGWTADMDIIVTTAGTGGAVEAQGRLLDGENITGGTPVGYLDNTSTVAFDTTVMHTIAVQATWTGAANPAQLVTQRQFIIERLN
jgi:hypothetical protein